MTHLSSFLKSAFFLTAATLLFLSLASYSPYDITWLTFPPLTTSANIIGVTGAYAAFVLFFLCGYAAYFVPFYLFFLGIAVLGKVRFHGLAASRLLNSFAFIFFISFLAAFVSLFFKGETTVFKSSGIVGFFLGEFFKKYLNFWGSFIVVGLAMFATAMLLFGFFLVDVCTSARAGLQQLQIFRRITQSEAISALRKIFHFFDVPAPAAGKDSTIKTSRKESAYDSGSVKSPPVAAPRQDSKPEIKVYQPKMELRKDSSKIEPAVQKMSPQEAQKKMEDLEKQAAQKYDPARYVMPRLNLLKVPPHVDLHDVQEDIEANIKNLEETLAEFGVEAKVVSVQKGPVVTMYELEPAAGVKIQKISALGDDITLAMKSSSVRIVAPIPGRGTVGVEIPNEKKLMVFLREVLEEKVFIDAPSKLSLVIGKDVSGNPVVADLKEMPHLLIAGATGAGKTVCVNSIISSILFKAKPDEVKLILVDPKMVELTTFSGIAHLIHPVIVEAKKAFIALNWAVGEMERRYKILAQEGVRNIDGYNRGSRRMPFIVIVVDELADMMLVARESVETSIQRLAQLSRAVGIHLILATQRPSVDVITGIIKANFPARISFKVSSKVDSRTILDAMGADKLLGKGDLLFLKPGATKIIRAQGAYIDDEDIARLTEFVRSQGAPEYESGITEVEKKGAHDIVEDELIDEAIKIVLQSKQASASILQRRMRVGYTRAARLLDLMEQRCIVGPFCGSKAREILVEPEVFLAENYSSE